MLLIRLFFEFFRAGLFAVGGGLATIPFLSDMGARTGWFSAGELADMIAVSESTPGPLGVNMASYVGFNVGGPVGCVVATLGLVAPSILIILIIARFLVKFRQSRVVEAVFYGLRPASTALITVAGLEVVRMALLRLESWGSGPPWVIFDWKAIALAGVILVCTRVWSKVHPVAWIALSAAAGILFQM